MAKLRIKKHKSIGAVAAENDTLLEAAFLDLGYTANLVDTSHPSFLILGRTGVGKTALLERIKSTAEHVSVLDPEELSMQYLHSSPILSSVLTWGINMDIFYKFLWRHVCILELIRMRYGEAKDVPSVIDHILGLGDLINTGKKKTKDTSRQYLTDYGGDYWVKTDTRIKTIANELSNKLIADEQIGAKLKVAGAVIGGSSRSHSAQESSTKVDYEVKERVQSIVSDYLIADLNRVIELLTKHGFSDPQKRYYILIDNLDKDWMPDDATYLDLIKSLISSVNDVNHRLAGVKILVALRDNIFFRVYKKAGQHEPQREKLADVTLNLKWTRAELIHLVEKRLAATFSVPGSNDPPPSFSSILPAKKKKSSQNPVDYILDRTLLRPRDTIDFVNKYLDQVSRMPQGKPTWTSLLQAEVAYSKGRLDSLHDEWKDSYFGLPALYKIFGRSKKVFRLADISQDDINVVLLHDLCEKCPWLKMLQESYAENRATNDDIRRELAKAAFVTGLLGVKSSDSDHVVYSYELTSLGMPWQSDEDAFFHIHRTFWSALGIQDEES